MKISLGEISRITISGFRGINIPPLELDFKKEHSLRSMIIYGRNGSGKSSIVDALEWLFSGEIKFLARKEAGPQAYPHRKADKGQTYIEVEFTNGEIGNIKMEYDPNRITQPKIIGNLSKLREFIQHPCHLRYKDLTELAYKGAAEKYETFSRYMGFANSLNIQNELQKCAGRLEKELEKFKRDKDELEEEYKEVSGEEPKNEDIFTKIFNTILNRQDITPVSKLTEVEPSLKKLRMKVEKDERSQKLSLWMEIQGIINKLYPVKDLRPEISNFQKNLKAFKQDEEEVSKLILLELYEKGIDAIESLKIYDTCPLCDKPYEGDLIEHIKSKKCHLKELSEKINKLETKRKELLILINNFIKIIEITLSNLEGKDIDVIITQLKECIVNVKQPLEECKDILENDIKSIDKDFDFITRVDIKEYNSLLKSEEEIKEKVSKKIETLSKDESRKLLVSDFQIANKLENSFTKWTQLNKKIKKFKKISSTFEKIKSDYIESTKRSVEASFDKISSDVSKYFKILEIDNKVVADPKIILISEKDKAVELEIKFGGDTVRPIYKVLSESQISSFGLSVFLASVKNFNTSFKFIIFDDIINSFDAHKRLYIIDLLSKHFSDYQILLLTHDSIWLDLLQKRFPQWIRKHFTGWDYIIGPRMEPGKNAYERINEYLLKDNPNEAGLTFGVYLEWILQQLCENLKATVIYKRRKDYTLSELFQAFKERFKKKLNNDHLVVKLILDFETVTGFRNFCHHWKEPEIPYTSPEIGEIVKKWKEIESKIECDVCHTFISYEKKDGYEHIICPCTNLDLKSDQYY